MKPENFRIFKPERYLMKIILFVIVYCSLLTANGYGQSITWERVYNGPGNNSDGARSICIADGDNMYVVGYTFINGSDRRILVLKLNPYGDTIWTRIIGGDVFGETDAIGGQDAQAVVASGDGGCVITGGGWDSAFTIKIASTGIVEWQKFYGGNAIQLYDIKKTLDGGYIACGRDDNVNFDGIIVKIDSTGDLEWQRTYNSLFYKIFFSIEIAHDGGYILVGGISNSNQDYRKGFITKINESGDTLWNRVFSLGTITSADKIVRINNGYLIGGNMIGYVQPFDHDLYYFFKVDLIGDSVSAKVFESLKREYLYDVKLINNNRYIFVGGRDSSTNILNGEIRITDSSGLTLKEKILPSPDYIVLYSILPQSNGDIVIAGEADLNMNPFNDAYVVKVDSNLGYTPIGIDIISSSIPKRFELFQNFPNPFNPETNITFNITKPGQIRLIITDVVGKLVNIPVDKFLDAGTYRLKWEAINLSSGIYFYALISDDFKITKKMLLIK